ncbi:hypothetical protein PSYJA_12305, partial [Pseudomonas syringae pv. japonica str. M301072]
MDDPHGVGDRQLLHPTKPSERDPSASLLMARLLKAAGLPA